MKEYNSNIIVSDIIADKIDMDQFYENTDDGEYYSFTENLPEGVVVDKPVRFDINEEENKNENQVDSRRAFKILKRDEELEKSNQKWWSNLQRLTE